MSSRIDGDILEQLISLEPVFHRFEHLAGRTPARADFDGLMAPDFFEVGASGRLYTREFVLQTLEQRFRNPSLMEEERWKTSEFHLLRLGPETWLLSYLLDQNLPAGHRLSRRTTLWRQTSSGWQVIFHQGTLTSAREVQRAAPVNPTGVTNHVE